MGHVHEREQLGVLAGKEYWYNVKRGVFEWRVPDIRESVRAEAGYKILAADYSQIEVKIMAYLSGDPWLISAINSGKDIHCYMATEVFGDEMGFTYEEMIEAINDVNHPRHHELKKLRSDIKTCTFGIPYGAGPPRVAMMTGKTIEGAEELMAKYFSKARVLKEWTEKQGRDAIRYGYTTSPRGRKRFYVMPAVDDPEREQILGQIRRWAGNHPIQAGNVDMLKPAMAMIYEAFRARGWTWEDARILFVVHDEIVVTCRTELAEEAAEIMRDCMTKSYEALITSIKNEVKVLIGDEWLKG
jgi:DNA polymerase-1